MLTVRIPSVILICLLATSADLRPLLRSSSFPISGGVCDLMVFIRVDLRSVSERIFIGAGAPHHWLITEEMLRLLQQP